MHKIALTIVALGLSASAAFAQSDFSVNDADGNGELSLAELRVIRGEVKDDDFRLADTDGSGGLSEDEYNAFVASTPEPSLSDPGPDAESTERGLYWEVAHDGLEPWLGLITRAA